MCGIVGATAERDVVPILLEGLRRLEYRGYDSAGLAVRDADGKLQRLRTKGKVAELVELYDKKPLHGRTGISHTRWATHGKPSTQNAHPIVSSDSVAVAHNGIIENHAELRDELQKAGYSFDTETDTEVIAHLVHRRVAEGDDLLEAVRATVARLKGAFALAVISDTEAGRVVGARLGSPLVVGVGIGENFLASDTHALLPVTNRFIYLEEGDIVDIRRENVRVIRGDGKTVEREVHETEMTADATDRGPYRHYMLKEIFEQPDAIAATLEGRIGEDHVLEQFLGEEAEALLPQVQAVHIVACGTSYHAGLVASLWLEGLAGLPCRVELGSEYRYRPVVVQDGTLFVTISQSGETADVLAALRAAGEKGYLGTLTVCNKPESSVVRESDFVLMTRAGPEIGVASTKAFTTQLVALFMLVVAIARHHGLDEKSEKKLIKQLASLPERVRQVLELDDHIRLIAENFADKHHALFLGRGAQYPVAMEGALKLKEISYIHAEAYPAGELKHGPLALVDHDMPVIAVAPNNELLEKLKSNLEEVRARGAELYVFADSDAPMSGDDRHVIEIAPTHDMIAPIIFTVPLQLLAYHVAVMKGTDIDQPRNLAKSVTVE